MKIKSIKFTNHPILKNLSIDFTNESNHAVDTIILAGENGAGKSSILHAIYEFSTFRTYDERDEDEKREITVCFSNDEINIIAKNSPRFQQGILNNELTFLIDYSIRGNKWSRIKFLGYTSQGQVINGDGSSFSDCKEIFKSIFSEVEINFNTGPIEAVRGSNIDVEVKESIKSDSNLPSRIAQLLVDVQALDDRDTSEWVKENRGKPVPEHIIDVRMKRFNDAFSFIFENKKFKRIDNKDNQKHVIFEIFGKEVSLNLLSSGEKQIIFRGSFLLQNQKTNKGAMVLIDEPEISMHPSWQLKILDFYKRLFSDENGLQTSQIFVVTHSPFIIHNTNRNKDKVIVLKRNEDGIFISKNSKYYGWTSEKEIEAAFNINFKLNNDKPIVFVEGEIDELYLKDAIFALKRYDFDEIGIRWIGRINENKKAEFTGNRALEEAKKMYQANPDLFNNKIILLYDSDCQKPDEEFNNLYIRSVPFNDTNQTFRKGIENLLSLPTDFPLEVFYDLHTQNDGYGGFTERKSLRKMELCKYIVDLDPIQKHIIYKNFNHLYDLIQNTLK